MNVLILGLGVSGRAAAHYFGGRVYALDDKCEHLLQDPEIQDLMKRGLTFVQDVPENTELIVVSPGISAAHPALQKGIPVVGEVELAARRLAARDWMGITGTNGKTTVTLFMDHLLKKAGRQSAALGNVGTPLLTHDSPEGEVIIAELSSYQLETMKTPILKAGALLNITPDHLDRYPNMEAYARAKMRIFDYLRERGTLIVNQKTVAEWPALFRGRSFLTFGYERGADIYFDGIDVHVQGQKTDVFPDSYRGLKTHDVENWMAAYGLAQVFGIKDEVFKEALTSFVKPRHRIEPVGECAGRSFFDDSKGTNIDATIRAVEAMKGRGVLIAGGVHKGFSYLSWKKAFEGKVKAICTIGQAASMIQKDLQDSFPIVHCQSMEEAVSEAARWAEKGDFVLLSPGCSSFDMYKDYAHRGEEFQRCVHNWMRTNK